MLLTAALNVLGVICILCCLKTLHIIPATTTIIKIKEFGIISTLVLEDNQIQVLDSSELIMNDYFQDGS